MTGSAPRFKVGVDLHPQHCTVQKLRDAWRAADELGVDTIWTWDHFLSLPPNPFIAPSDGGVEEGNHFEGWSLLSAMAVETSRAQIGLLVTANGYRNPDLLADMARTVDHLSEGRVILGIGAGWAERDYVEYGYEYGPPAARLKDLEQSLRRIKARLSKLKPGPIGPLPILVGGGGEKVTLRLAAQYANMWNAFSPVETWARKNGILDEWCSKVGRDPKQIERTIGIPQQAAEEWRACIEAGAQHIILMHPPPFDLSAARYLLEAARA